MQSAHKHSLLLEDNSRYSHMPAVNERSRILAEAQYQQINDVLSKHNVQADYRDLMIKKGEIYKEHLGIARSHLEQEAMAECTFRPALNDERNKRKNSKSKIKQLMPPVAHDYPRGSSRINFRGRKNSA